MQVQQKIAPTDGKHVRFGKTLGTRRVLPATATGGGFGLVEYDLPPGQLDSPVHTHQRENEYSCVLSGRLNRAGRRRRGRGRPWRARRQAAPQLTRRRSASSSSLRSSTTIV
jgi:hypothetical protein